MLNVHSLRRNVKNVVKNYSDAQIKVREATSNDPWGPSGTLMSEIADLTYNVVAFSEIMQVLWKRLNDHGKNWKHVYKALVLLEYLLKSGSERVAHQCKENIFAIETLKDFQHMEDNKDQGVNIREKAKLLASLLRDEDRLRNERLRALKARERFAQETTDAHKHLIDDIMNPRTVSRSPTSGSIPSPTAVFVSELERVRPQTMGEEELQLQLALAMSKEEADQEQRLKRNDELRLQMAISESRDSYEHNQLEEMERKRQSTAMDDLIDVFSEMPTSPTVDPWGVPGATQSDFGSGFASPESERNINMASGDMACRMSVGNHSTGLHNIPENSPDLISSSTPRDCYNFSSVRNSMSADSDEKSPDENKPRRFLGENANLVNLDSLVESGPPATGLVSNPFSSQSDNPFQTSRRAQPSINEIRAQNNTFPTTINLPRFHSPQMLLPRVDNPPLDPGAAPFPNPFI